MNTINKLKYKAIAYGIVWVWVIAILNEYINIDGWILYPICFTGVFLLMVAGVKLLLACWDITLCSDCRGYYLEKEKDLHICERKINKGRF